MKAPPLSGVFSFYYAHMQQLPNGEWIDPIQIETVTVQEDTVETCMGVDVAYMIVIRLNDGTEHVMDTYPSAEEAQHEAERAQRELQR